MKKEILITDTLFISEQDEKILEKEGFKLLRLKKTKATEAELIEVIRGKSGYILGGIEQVTTPVIEEADKLEVICFTGTAYDEFIPAHQYATRKGIAITAAAGANAQAVAEYAITLMMAMVRNISKVTAAGKPQFYEARELGAMTLGVIGYGTIGRLMANIGCLLGMRVLVTGRKELGKLNSGMKAVQVKELLETSDVVTLHVNKQHGEHCIGAKELATMKDEAILINTAFPQAVDLDALHIKLKQKRLRAAFDSPPNKDFSDIDPEYFMTSNVQTGFYTTEAIKRTNNRVTQSLINMLLRGDDSDLKNPEFRQYKK